MRLKAPILRRGGGRGSTPCRGGGAEGQFSLDLGVKVAARGWWPTFVFLLFVTRLFDNSCEDKRVHASLFWEALLPHAYVVKRETSERKCYNLQR